MWIWFKTRLSCNVPYLSFYGLKQVFLVVCRKHDENDKTIPFHVFRDWWNVVTLYRIYLSMTSNVHFFPLDKYMGRSLTQIWEKCFFTTNWGKKKGVLHLFPGIVYSPRTQFSLIRTNNYKNKIHDSLFSHTVDDCRKITKHELFFGIKRRPPIFFCDLVHWFF